MRFCRKKSEGSHGNFIHISRCELSSTTKTFLKVENYLSIAAARLFRERNRLVKEQEEIASISQCIQIRYSLKIKNTVPAGHLAPILILVRVLSCCTSFQAKHYTSQTPLQLEF